MEMFRHYDVGNYIEYIVTPNLFKDRKKKIARLGRSEQGPPMETARCDVVEVTVAVVASPRVTRAHYKFNCVLKPIFPTHRKPRCVGHPAERKCCKWPVASCQ